MSEGDRARYWSELEGDASLRALRIGVMGWLPRKRERLNHVSRSDALCVLVRGGGVFVDAGQRESRPIRGPGLILVPEGAYSGYGPVDGGRWDEFFWSLSGPRVAEWKRSGWWPEEIRFRTMEPAEVGPLWEMFRRGVEAIERRDGRALDLHKLEIERWLCERAWRPPEPSGLERLVESWRREPERPWSLPGAARELGQGYTTFRGEFLRRYGTSPYDYLLRLRVELAANLLRGTREPVKSVAGRCGFKNVETFLRAFKRVHGLSPGRWRDGG